MLQNAFDKTLINHFFVSVIEIIERSKQMFLMMGLLKIQSLFGQRPNYTVVVVVNEEVKKLYSKISSLVSKVKNWMKTFT